ncbi:MAG: hypothetical protein FJ387_28610 [Verrucomicrobia bacterium]|nr:hypothetical protein [Verrucomicrobiota bacterium]
MTELVDIVSARVKAEVLRLLFGLQEPELHLRELARQSVVWGLAARSPLFVLLGADPGARIES